MTLDAETERLLERGAVLLEPQGPAKLTEYGKRYFSKRLETVDRHWDAMWDIIKLAKAEQLKWPAMEAALAAEGVPTAISSGLSNYSQLKALDYLSGKTTSAFAMSTTAVALTTGAVPTVSTTGACGDNTGQYGGYTRLTVTVANFVAASGTNPAQTTYSSAGAVTFPACTSSTATETGFVIADATTVNTGNAFFYGTLTSVVISTTATPPTIAQNAMVLSLNGT